jgi:pimeloyl-ACP methyl ester carboxylesterase
MADGMRKTSWLVLLLAIALLVAAAAPRKSSTPKKTATPAVRSTTPPPIGDVLGDWRGYAEREGARLELGVRFERERGTLRAAVSSADLMLLDAPVEGVSHIGKNVRFLTPDDRPVRFVGRLERDSIVGSGLLPDVPGVAKADRGTPSIRLVLARAKASPPPPYARRDVSFTNGAVRLAGTLHVPPGAGPLPGVVLLPGSSSRRRLDLRFQADHLARAGFAVLVFDKRGTGESTGDHGTATYEQLADDATAAVAFLCTQPGVDRARVGVWGLSQGAILAPMVAARVPGLRFVVAISAPGRPLGEAVVYQDSVRLVQAGFDAADIRRATTIERRLVAWLADGRDEAELAALLANAESTPWRRASSLPARLPSGATRESWYWRGRTLDPEPVWRAVKAPVLAIYGAADELLLAPPNAKAVERALKKGGNRDVTVRVFPNANHVLRTLPGLARGPWDWPRAAPGHLELVTAWMKEKSR